MLSTILSFILAALFLCLFWRFTMLDKHFFSTEKMAEKRMAVLFSSCIGGLIFSYFIYQNIPLNYDERHLNLVEKTPFFRGLLSLPLLTVFFYQLFKRFPSLAVDVKLAFFDISEAKSEKIWLVLIGLMAGSAGLVFLGNQFDYKELNNANRTIEPFIFFSFYGIGAFFYLKALVYFPFVEKDKYGIDKTTAQEEVVSLFKDGLVFYILFLAVLVWVLQHHDADARFLSLDILGLVSALFLENLRISYQKIRKRRSGISS